MLTEQPVSYRTSDVVAGNSNFITLRNLEPSTQYQVTVVAVKGGKRYRSRPTIFLTMGKSYSRKINPLSLQEVVLGMIRRWQHVLAILPLLVFSLQQRITEWIEVMNRNSR
jgi:hypothetical protein